MIAVELQCFLKNLKDIRPPDFSNPVLPKAVGREVKKPPLNKNSVFMFVLYQTFFKKIILHQTKNANRFSS